MTVGPGDEAPRGDLPPGGSEATTFAFGDRAAGRHGLARVGRSADGSASALGVLFDGADPVAVSTEGVTAETLEPLRRWRVTFAGAFVLDVEALTAPAEVPADDPAAVAGGMQGYDQLCRVRGEAAGRTVDALGQRARSWGRPDWDRIGGARTISAWFAPDRAVSLTAIRRTGAKGQDADAVAAHLVTADGPVPVAEARLSTTYDGDGRQRHAGLELYLEPEGGHPHRLAGEALCGTTLDLGRLRMDTAFFRWRMHGHDGVGRYDVIRHADADVGRA